MLLAHRSGLQEYLDDPAVARALDDPRHRWTREEALAGIRRAVFPPGTRYRYTTRTSSRASTLRTMTALDHGGNGLGLYGEDFNGRRWLGHSGS